ncbi:MAG: HU family DNA-binding protein [Patescibacteria group bacterium]|nr:HU family DNA-binding protein [Patescibacteria group bacterium]
MNKSELISAVADKTEASKKDAENFVDSFTDIVIDTLKAGGEVALTGFGTFSAKQRAARTGRNPQTGETIQIKATVVPKFKAGKNLKDALKK